MVDDSKDRRKHRVDPTLKEIVTRLLQSRVKVATIKYVVGDAISRRRIYELRKKIRQGTS